MSNTDKPTDPIENKEDVRKNEDPHIDQDFPGFPDARSSEEIVNPKTGTEKKTADLDHRDGEKKLDADKDKQDVAEKRRSDGSANAFERTELTAKPVEKEDDGSSNY